MAEIIPLNTPLERYSLMAVALVVAVGGLIAFSQFAQAKSTKDSASSQMAEAKQ